MLVLIQSLQLASGILWLIPAVVLTPRIVASWKKDASRATILAAPIGFISWLMVGFSIRWVVWPQTIDGMTGAELTTWGALYLLSAVLAGWVFSGALHTRDE